MLLSEVAQVNGVSIHAPAQGATYCWRVGQLLFSFNSRPRAGGDSGEKGGR